MGSSCRSCESACCKQDPVPECRGMQAAKGRAAEVAGTVREEAEVLRERAGETVQVKH